MDLSLDGVAVPGREQDLLQLFLHHLLVVALLQHHADAAVEEALQDKWNHNCLGLIAPGILGLVYIA